MTPRLSVIGSSIRKLFAGIGGDGGDGGDGDLYWNDVILAMHMDTPTDLLWSKTVLAMHMNEVDPHWSSTVLATHLDQDAYWNNVVLAMHMDGADNSTTFTDSKGKTVTGSGNALIKTGVKNFGTASAYFDGVNSYLSTPITTDFQFSSGDYTIEAWVYTSAWPTGGAWHAVVSNYNDSSDPNQGFRLLLGDTGHLNFNYRSLTDDSNRDITTPAGTIPLNTWVHVAVCKTATRLAIYVNGVARVIESNPHGVNTTTYNLFVGSTNGAAWFWNGYIDDLRITKGVARYVKDFEPLKRTFSENAFVDEKDKVISKFGDVALSSLSPFSSGYSATFDGVGDYLTVPAGADFNFGTGALTIEGWVRSDLTQQGTVFDMWDGLDGTDTLIYVTTSGSISWFYEYSGGAGQSFSGQSGAIAANTWAHFACVREASGALYIYINGVKQPSTATKTTQMGKATRTVHIGNRMNGTNNFKGQIADYRITKGVARYTKNFRPSNKPFRELTTYPSFIDERGNRLAPVGSVSISTASSKFGGASALFNGTTDYLLTSTSTDFAFGTGDFTIELWLKTSTSGPVIDTRSVIQDLGLFAIDNGVLAFWNGANYLRGLTTVTDNSWHHVVWTRSKSLLTMYVDGKIDGVTYQVSSFGTSRPLRIGTNFDASAFFNGNIDDLRISKTGRYVGEFSVPQYQFLDDVNASIVIDETGKAIESVGNYSISLQSKFGGAVQFDGSNDKLIATGLTSIGAADYTAEAWIYKINDTSFSTSAGSIVLDFRTADPDTNLNLYYTGSAAALPNRLALLLNGVDVLVSTSQLQTNVWTHVAIVRHAGTVKLYINGVSEASASDTTNMSGTTCHIGGRWTATVGDLRTMNGRVDDLRITKVARYVNNFSVPTKTFKDYGKTNYDEHIANVVLLMHMDGANDGTVFTDLTGKTVTPTGVVTKSGVKKFGTASAYFDGVDDYLQVGGSPLLPATGDWTIECWIYRSVANVAHQMYSQGDTAIAGRTFFLVESTNQLNFFVGSTTNLNLFSSSSIPAQTWTHVAATRSGNTFLMFINGKLEGSGVLDQAIDQTSLNLIGKNQSVALPRLFNGYIDDFRITSGVARYTGDFQPIQLPFPEKAFDPQPVVADPHLNNVVLGMHMDGANDGTVFTEFTGKTVTRVEAVTKTGVKKFGTASAYFDGADDYLTVQDSEDFEFGTGAFTIECWFNSSGLPAVSGTMAIVAKGGTANSNLSYRLVIYNSAGTYLIFYQDSSNGTGLSANFSGSPTLTTGVWRHLAVSRDGTSVRMFLDGIQIGSSATLTSILNSTATVVVGAEGAGISNFNGYIDDLRITKGVARYSKDFTPPGPFPEIRHVWDDPYFASVVLLMHMNGSNNGTTFTDVKGNTVSANGGAVTKTDQKKFGSASAYFDGVDDFLSTTYSSNFQPGTGDFTIEAWVLNQSTDTVNNKTIFSTRGTSAIGFTCGINHNGTAWRPFITGWTSVDVSGLTLFGSVTLTAGVFNHVVFSKKGMTWRIYVNGQYAGAGTETTAYGAGSYAQIGNEGVSTTRLWQGYIDELRITKGAARYTSQHAFEPPQAPCPDA